MPDKCLDCPVPSADMDGFIVSGPGGAPRSEGSGVSSPEGPFVREAPQMGHFILKGKVSSSSPLPDVPEPGWAYEAAEAGTYGGAQATAGDVVWCAGVNPVRWAILQSDSGSAVSVEQILSSGTKIATVTVDGQATDLFCNPSGLASVSASFECREEPVQIPLCFWADLCEYWDDGETDGCYTEDVANDPVNFSLVSGVETKIATLQTVPDTSDLYYVLALEIGDISYNGRSVRAQEREASSTNSLYYCSFHKNCGSQFIQVGESQNITFSELDCLYYVDGDPYRHFSTTSVSSTNVTINSELFGQYEVSARMVREPDGPNGEYVISIYATAVSAEAGSGTTPVLSLTSTGADGTSSTQEVDMSCLAGGGSGKVDCFTADVAACTSTDVVDIESLYEGSYDNVYSMSECSRTLFYTDNYVFLEFNIFADTAIVKTLFATFEVYLPNTYDPIVLGFVIDVSSISPSSTIRLDNVPLYEFDYVGNEYRLSYNFSLTDVHIFATHIPLTSCTCLQFSANVNKLSTIDTSFSVDYVLSNLSYSNTPDLYKFYDKFPTKANTVVAIEGDHKVYTLTNIPNFSIDPIINTRIYKVLDRNAVFSFNLISPYMHLIPNLLYVVDLYIDNSGGYTMTWPSSIKWSGGATPAFSTTGMNIVRLSSLDAGTTWYGEIRFAE